VTPDERSRRLRQLAIAGGLAVVIVAVAIVASQSGSDNGGGDSDPADDTAAVEELFDGIPQEGVELGDPDAPVTLVEYADLQCPFCRDFAVDALPAVVEEYVRSGQVRLEFQPVSIVGDHSGAAAELGAAAAMQGRLWELIDVFYRNQGIENSGYVTDEFLTEIAEATPGLDVEVALADRTSPEGGQVPFDAERAFRRAGLDSTPSFLVGETGGRLEPAQVEALDAAAFRELLDSALARADG
jgi:protein-disulfide isomerase